jgi:hypothetical protein
VDEAPDAAEAEAAATLDAGQAAVLEGEKAGEEAAEKDAAEKAAAGEGKHVAPDATTAMKNIHAASNGGEDKETPGA